MAPGEPGTTFDDFAAHTPECWEKADEGICTCVTRPVEEAGELEIELRAKLHKAYSNGLSDIVAQSTGVIEGNGHAYSILNFMVQDLMKLIDRHAYEVGMAVIGEDEPSGGVAFGGEFSGLTNLQRARVRNALRLEQRQRLSEPNRGAKK